MTQRRPTRLPLWFALGAILLLAPAISLANNPPASSADERLELLRDRSPAVETALADSVVSVDEVRAALASGLECARRQHVDVEGSFEPTGDLSLSIRGSETNADADADLEVVMECLKADVEPLAKAFGITNAPSMAAIEKAKAEEAACIAEIPAEASELERLQLQGDCRTEAELSLVGGSPAGVGKDDR